MRIIVTFLFLLLCPALQAQTNTYLADLSALRAILQKTPSYKAQVKGPRLKAYNALYNRLAADTVSNSYQYFYNLAQLLFPLRDNHLGFYGLPDYNNFKTKSSIDSFVASKAFAAFPKYNIDTDSLKTAMAQKPADAIEGLYHHDTFYTVALFKKREHEYVGVVVHSNVNLWQKGQVAMHLYQHTPGYYKAIYAHPFTRHFILQPNEKYRNGSLINSSFYGAYTQQVYSKKLRQTDHVNVPKEAPLFQFKNIGNNIQYVLIRTFQANNKVSGQSHRFYQSIKDSLRAPYLIVDLRNNAGGATKESLKYAKLIRKYARKGHVYLLLNNETLSQAEKLTLKLQKLKNVTTLGQTTKGMLTYGSNFGKREKQPSQQFEIYITDMRGRPKYLQYEDKGINPEIFLNEDADWIDQTIQLIEKNNAGKK